jgi:hypothetical protein
MHREITAKKIVRYGSMILLFVVIAGYGIWISRDLLFGIKVSVIGIHDGMSTSEPLLSLSGTAKHASDVTLDGRIMPVDQDGAWHDTIALESGYNIVTIGAGDRFGRKTTTEYRVYYTPRVVQ